MMPRLITLAFALISLTMPAMAETVRVAHPELPPFTYVEGGNTVGLIADILRAAAAREGIDIAFVPLSGGVRETLTNGTADAVAPMPILSTPDAPYDFSTSFLITGGALFVRAPNPTPDLAALSGKTVVTPVSGPFVSLIQHKYPNVKVVPTNKSTMADEYRESLDQVVNGQADAAALNIREGARVVAASYAGKITVPTTMFQELSLAVGVIKGQHADLLKRLDAGLAAIHADGTLQRIEDKWKDR